MGGRKGGEDDFEVVDAAAASAGGRNVPDDEVIEFGAPHIHHPQVVDRWHDRLPRWLIRPPRVPTFALVIGIALGVAIAIAINGVQQTSVAQSPSPSPSSTPPASLGSGGSPQLPAIMAIATSTAKLQNYSIVDRSPRCPHGTVQYPDPVNAAVAAVTSVLDDFSLVDASRAEDLSGVCGIKVRLRDENGSVIVVGVDSPPNAGGVPLVLIENDGQNSVVDVVALSNGWRIELVASGVIGQQPQTNDLQNISADPRLTW